MPCSQLKSMRSLLLLLKRDTLSSVLQLGL